MLVNGKVRQSCTALVDNLKQPIVLEPMSKFPVVRDLQVDRTRMFDNLKKVKAWIDIDGTHNVGEGPLMSDKIRANALCFIRVHDLRLLSGSLSSVHPQ